VSVRVWVSRSPRDSPAKAIESPCWREAASGIIIDGQIGADVGREF
jgi:hypothetical protein